MADRDLPRRMRVFVAGATGVLGWRLVRTCAERGHDVVGLSLDDEGAKRVREAGGTPRRGDVLDRSSVLEAAEGADVVVHAATSIPTDPNPSDEDWAANDRVRRAGTEHLLDAAAAVGADRFVLQSVVWLVRRPDGRPVDTSAEPNPDRTTRSALDAERLLSSAAVDHGFEPVVLRGGWFYAPDAAHTRTFGERLLARRLPIVGGGPLGRRDATLSFVHVDDVAAAFADAVAGAATGTFHVVDDEPTTYADFLRTFADRLGAPPPRRVPAWLARLLVDRDLVRMLTSPMPTSNRRLREAFGWSPDYPSVREGLDEVVVTWREEGTVTETEGGMEWTGT